MPQCQVAPSTGLLGRPSTYCQKKAQTLHICSTWHCPLSSLMRICCSLVSPEENGRRGAQGHEAGGISTPSLQTTGSEKMGACPSPLALPSENSTWVGGPVGEISLPHLTVSTAPGGNGASNSDEPASCHREDHLCHCLLWAMRLGTLDTQASSISQWLCSSGPLGWLCPNQSSRLSKGRCREDSRPASPFALATSRGARGTGPIAREAGCVRAFTKPKGLLALHLLRWFLTHLKVIKCVFVTC